MYQFKSYLNNFSKNHPKYHNYQSCVMPFYGMDCMQIHKTCRHLRCLGMRTCEEFQGSCMCKRGYHGNECQFSSCSESCPPDLCAQNKCHMSRKRPLRDFVKKNYQKYFDRFPKHKEYDRKRPHDKGYDKKKPHDKPRKFWGREWNWHFFENRNKICKTNNCLNRGECRALGNSQICVCPTGVIGKVCEVMLKDKVQCFNNCSNRGTCNSNTGNCNCYSGYHGDHCQYNEPLVSTCNVDSCHHGRCLFENGVARCVCSNPNFRGDKCEEAIHPCLSQPCLHYGTCVPHVDSSSPVNFEIQTSNHKEAVFVEKMINNWNTTRSLGYKCLCNSGWNGTNCEIPQYELCSSNKCNDESEFCLNTDTGYSCLDINTCSCSAENISAACSTYCSRNETCSDICISKLNDDKCDKECNNSLCNYDGGDCTTQKNCMDIDEDDYCSRKFHDNVCDIECISPTCQWDGGDCDNKGQNELKFDIVFRMNRSNFLSQEKLFLRQLSILLRTPVIRKNIDINEKLEVNNKLLLVNKNLGSENNVVNDEKVTVQLAVINPTSNLTSNLRKVFNSSDNIISYLRINLRVLDEARNIDALRLSITTSPRPTTKPDDDNGHHMEIWLSALISLFVLVIICLTVLTIRRNIAKNEKIRESEFNKKDVQGKKIWYPSNALNFLKNNDTNSDSISATSTTSFAINDNKRKRSHGHSPEYADIPNCYLIENGTSSLSTIESRISNNGSLPPKLRRKLSLSNEKDWNCYDNHGYTKFMRKVMENLGTISNIGQVSEDDYKKKTKENLNEINEILKNDDVNINLKTRTERHETLLHLISRRKLVNSLPLFSSTTTRTTTTMKKNNIPISPESDGDSGWNSQISSVSQTNQLDERIVRSFLNLFNKFDMDWNGEDINGYTPLHTSIENDNYLMFKLLLSYYPNVDINYQSVDGTTPLIIISRSTIVNHQSSSSPSASSSTPMNVERLGNMSSNISTIQLSPVSAIPFDHNQYLNDLMEINSSTILRKSSNETTNSSKFSATCQIDLADKKGLTPLHWAVMVDNDLVFNELVRFGAHVTATDQLGKTILHHAVEENCVNILKSIFGTLSPALVKGMLESMDHFNCLPIDYARLQNNTNFIQLINDYSLEKKNFIATNINNNRNKRKIKKKSTMLTSTTSPDDQIKLTEIDNFNKQRHSISSNLNKPFFPPNLTNFNSVNNLSSFNPMMVQYPMGTKQNNFNERKFSNACLNDQKQFQQLSNYYEMLYNMSAIPSDQYAQIMKQTNILENYPMQSQQHYHPQQHQQQHQQQQMQSEQTGTDQKFYNNLNFQGNQTQFPINKMSVNATESCDDLSNVNMSAYV
ncbi:hypothetical protein SNEBB_010354 [Seison nebaliae]|nr:hypothetical protein SNEBB_010354 [Seison nebaliae]